MDISGIDNLGIERVLKRGSGEVIAEQDDALLVRDTVSGAYMLACEDPSAGSPLLDRYIGGDCDLLMVSNYVLGISPSLTLMSLSSGNSAISNNSPFRYSRVFLEGQLSGSQVIYR